MTEYFIYYASINFVGFIIFGIMLAHDCLGIDRQEKQLRYDQTLVAFMCYFLSDAVWSGVDAGIFPVSRFSVAFTAFINFVIMTVITYMWLSFVMALEQIPNRNKPSTRALLGLPFLISTVALLVTYFVKPILLIDENCKTTRVFDAFLVVIPYIYILGVIFYTMRRAIHEENPEERIRHLCIGLFPVLVVVGGLMQILLMPKLPIFCFSCTILMLIFYIQSMEAQISTDPLTNLNNRGQLTRYVVQSSNMHIDGRYTYVVMIDANDFKSINDTYGHAEGDEALVMIAQSLVSAVKNHTIPMFLGRYGGDEFILIAHPAKEEELKDLIANIRENIRLRCESENKPYMLTVGIGYDAMIGENDTFQKCMQRADRKLYLDKEYIKLSLKK